MKGDLQIHVFDVEQELPPSQNSKTVQNDEDTKCKQHHVSVKPDDIDPKEDHTSAGVIAIIESSKPAENRSIKKQDAIGNLGKTERKLHNTPSDMPSSSTPKTTKTLAAYPTNKTILALQKQERRNMRQRRDSIIRPPETRSISESIQYAWVAIIWIIYQSFVLGLIPLVATIMIFGSSMLFDVNNDSMLVYFLVFNIFFIFVLYSTFSSIFAYVFGKKRTMQSFMRYTIPLTTLHCIVHGLQIVYGISFLSLVYFSFFLMNYYIVLRCVEKSSAEEAKQQPEEKEKRPADERATMTKAEKRYETLASDGTPMALFKGLLSYFGIYTLMSVFLIRYLMKSGFLMRLIGRIVIIPLIANAADAYQNNLLIYKSKEYSRHRTLTGSLLNVTSLAIQRMIITNTNSITDTATLAVCASMSEIFFRVSYIPRTIYTMRILKYLKKEVKRKFISRKKVANLSNIAPYPAEEHHEGTDSKALRIAINQDSFVGLEGVEVEEEEIVEIEKIEWSIKGMRDLMSSLNESDNFTQYLMTYRPNRTYHSSVFEIQSSIYMPVILYLISPMSKYFSNEPFSGWEELLQNIMVQLSVEVVTQIICAAIEYNLFGTKLPEKRKWNIFMNFFLLAQYWLVILSGLYLSMYPFMLGTEEWPSE